MNRIILIGNGFDLAHNIKSSYSNFIEDFWENTIIELKQQPQRSQYSNIFFKISGFAFRFFHRKIFWQPAKLKFKTNEKFTHKYPMK